MWVLVLVFVSVLATPKPHLRTEWFEQHLDHFNFNAPSPRTFQQRYLINDDEFNTDSGCVLFYTGNEGNLDMFADNSGLLFEFAPKLKAMVVFAEHRFYGESLPFKKDVLTPAELGFLTTEQALADFAELVVFIRHSYKLKDSIPFIAFGGSYGGMLAAWSRMKYPHIFAGAIAASAPIAQFEGLVDPEAFSVVVTETFERKDASCPELVRRGFQTAIKSSTTDSGRSGLRAAFMTCDAITDQAAAEALIDFANGAVSFLAMTDYASPSDFLQPLPSWPVEEACNRAANSHGNELNSLAAVVDLFMNYTGRLPCLNVSEGLAPGLGDPQWDWQACTEMVMPIGSNGVDDMLPPEPWDLSVFEAGCKRAYGIQPRPYWAQTQWGGRDVRGASNIVFSNGKLDPWWPGGILKGDDSHDIVAILIEEGAHHADLRWSNDKDPESVVAARKLELEEVEKWVVKWRSV